jgi:riboflavin synthase
MFTGIVQRLCSVVEIRDDDGVKRLDVDLAELAAGLATGASVAVNGVCLTATGVAGARVGFDVIQETLAHTNLGLLRDGDLVNVERSLKFGDEIGGHVLSGHVADVVKVARVESAEGVRNLWFDVASKWMIYLFHKGFVALDGASLTIASIDRDRHRIAVSLIPETIRRTTLGTATVGRVVNLEVDPQLQAVVGTVERLLKDPAWRRQAGIA